MAKAYYRCAQCNGLVKVSGRNRKEADRYAEWKEIQEAICTDCWKAEQAKKHAADAEENADNGLPKLTGSSKQVARAEIKKKNLVSLNDIMRTFNLNPTDVAGLTRRSVKTVHDWINPRRPADIPDDTLELMEVYLCAFVASDYRDIPEDKLNILFKKQVKVDLL